MGYTAKFKYLLRTFLRTFRNPIFGNFEKTFVQEDILEGLFFQKQRKMSKSTQDGPRRNRLITITSH
jgi:hypothetical protein